MANENKTDLEQVREVIAQRHEESGDFDRLRLFIEIKEIAKFLEDVFRNTVPVVGSNNMDFFDNEELHEFYDEMVGIAILTSNSIIKFDRLLGDKKGLPKKETEKVSEDAPLTHGGPVGTSFTDKPVYVV